MTISDGEWIFAQTLVDRQGPRAKGRFDMVAPVPQNQTLIFHKTFTADHIIMWSKYKYFHLRTLGFIRLDSILRDLFLFA